MNVTTTTEPPLSWGKSLLYAALAVACFHIAYTPINFPVCGLFIFGYAFGLVQIANQPSVRRAFYFGLGVGFLCIAPQANFLWGIFGIPAIVLWIILAFWIGLFTAMVCGCIRRYGKVKTAWLIPIFWTGLEYFRSELYYLKFSWLNVGYALPAGFSFFAGMFGIGFLAFAVVTVCVNWNALNSALKATTKWTLIELLIVLVILLVFAVLLIPARAQAKARRLRSSPSIVGVQLEFPSENIIPKLLSQALAKNTNAQIFVLSEYTLDGPVPDSLKNWCRDHSRYLVVGGKDLVGTNDIYYNTAFVVGTNGDIVFQQAKSVPIQFFHDGLPAPEQKVWNSPWGKIGICICYDLSYTRVTDELVRQGAQLLIVPTMDLEDWGKHEHELHSRVAPVRAAEYGIPIFRLASSGISQAVTGGGKVIAQTRIGGNGDILSAKLQLPTRGALPLDRFLAPVCVAITGVTLFWLILLSLREKSSKKKTP
jgi:apolipoprotein N-acyltransferase